jgi:predicted nucleic acid-binding protein
MLTGLKGLVFKSEINEKGQTAYTIILGKKLILPWMYKTATLYKSQEEDSPGLELVINNMDSEKYRKKLKENKLTKISCDELEELSEYIKQLPIDKKEYLMKNIENLPEKIRRTVYDALNDPFFPNRDVSLLYNFEMQNISRIKDSKIRENNLESLSERLSNKIYDKLYKKAI